MQSCSQEKGKRGYVEVSLYSDTSSAYVVVEFRFNETLYTTRQTIGLSVTAIFPVLPGPVIVYVGNTNCGNPAMHVVTVTYH